MKHCKKALDVYKKSPTHKSSFASFQKVVQVADYKGFKKRYKTCQKLIILVFWEAQHVKKCKKCKNALDVCTSCLPISRAFRASKR